MEGQQRQVEESVEKGGFCCLAALVGGSPVALNKDEVSGEAFGGSVSSGTTTTTTAAHESHAGDWRTTERRQAK